MEYLNDDRLWSLEAEAAVLGSMIIDRGCIGSIIPILTEGSFFKQEHQIIYSALTSLYTVNQPIDAVVLRTKLNERNQLKQVGDVEYIAKLMNTTPSSANALYYAGVVKDKQRYRGLIDKTEKIQNVINEPLGVDEQVQKIQDIVLSIDAKNSEPAVYELAQHVTDAALAMRDHKDIIETGFHNIDRIVHGVSPGEFVILAGRPAMGKSALALSIVLNMSKAGKSVIYFTLEMTAQSLMQRAICQWGRLNLSELKASDCPQSKIEKSCETAFELKELDLVLHEGAATPERQIAFLRTRKKIHKVDAVVIDYLQLMSSGGRSENRQQEITTISRKLKLAAVQEQIPIIALSQLNRQVESRTDHRPRLSDLRESGSLEQDADIVMLLHREDYYRRIEQPDTKKVDGSTELIIAKNRRGPTGKAELVFLEESAKFGDALSAM